MKIEGTVRIDDKEVGTYVVDSDGRIVADLNGGRWTVEEVLLWAQDEKKSITLVPKS